MCKDFKYAQRPQAAFGRPKYPVAASGRLKILYDYISNNSKILGVKYFQIQFGLCILYVTNKKILEKVFFFKLPIPSCRLPQLSPTLPRSPALPGAEPAAPFARMILEAFLCLFLSRKKRKGISFQAARDRLIIYDCPEGNLYVLSRPLASKTIYQLSVLPG